VFAPWIGLEISHMGQRESPLHRLFGTAAFCWSLSHPTPPISRPLGIVLGSLSWASDPRPLHKLFRTVVSPASCLSECDFLFQHSASFINPSLQTIFPTSLCEASPLRYLCTVPREILGFYFLTPSLLFWWLAFGVGTRFTLPALMETPPGS